MNTCERSRDLREVRGLSQVGTIVDKEFFPRFRYVNRLRLLSLIYEDDIYARGDGDGDGVGDGDGDYGDGEHNI